MVFIHFLTLLSSVLAGANAIPNGVKNTEIFPRITGLASGALDRALDSPTSNVELTPTAFPTEIRHDRFSSVEDGNDSESSSQDGPEASEIGSASPVTETLTRSLVTTVSLAPAIVTRTRFAEPEASNIESMKPLELVSKPTATEYFPVAEPSGSHGDKLWNSTDSAIDATPTQPSVVTTTLFVPFFPARATHTVPCIQPDQLCASMVLIVAPLATLDSPPKEGTPVPGDVAASTTFAASFSSLSLQSWPTRTLNLAVEIMPTRNPMTVACERGPPDVDCSKFASVVIWAKPMPTMSLPVFKAAVTNKPTQQLVTQGYDSKPISTPEVAPQGFLVNVPPPVQTSSSTAQTVVLQSNKAQSTLSPFAQPPAGWRSGTSLRPDLPFPFGDGRDLSAPVSIIQEASSSITSCVASNDGSFKVPSATVVPISPLPSAMGIIPPAPLPTGTGTVISPAPLTSASMLTTASPPKFSAYDSSNGHSPIMGIHRHSAASGSFESSCLALVVSLFAGFLTMA